MPEITACKSPGQWSQWMTENKAEQGAAEPAVQIVDRAGESFLNAIFLYTISKLATRLSTRQGRPKSLVCNELHGRLSLTLVRANSRAILSRSL